MKPKMVEQDRYLPGLLECGSLLLSELCASARDALARSLVNVRFTCSPPCLRGSFPSYCPGSLPLLDDFPLDALRDALVAGEFEREGALALGHAAETTDLTRFARRSSPGRYA